MRRTDLAIIALLVAATSVACLGGNTNQSTQPHFSGQAAGEKQKILQKIEGTITSTDTNEMTLTIKSDGKVQAAKLTSKTKIKRSDGSPAAIRDARTGALVEAIVVKVYGQPDEFSEITLKPDNAKK